jgi:hypothetical protein
MHSYWVPSHTLQRLLHQHNKASKFSKVVYGGYALVHCAAGSNQQDPLSPGLSSAAGLPKQTTLAQGMMPPATCPTDLPKALQMSFTP